MQLKHYVKTVTAAVLQPIAKSLWGINPSASIGVSMLSDRVFRWSLGGNAAYNNKIFYTGTRLLVRKMIEAPITFNRKKSNPKKSIDKFYSKTIGNPERSSIKAQSVDELADHELAGMFTLELMEDFWHNYTFGDGFLWFESAGEELSRNNKPIAVHSLRPNRVEIVTNNQRFDNVEYYRYTCLNGEQIPIPKNQVLHLKHWNPNVGELKGYGVDVAASMDISLNNAGNTAEGAAYENGGRGTLFSSKVDVTNEGNRVFKATAEQMSALKSTVENDMSGARNNRKMKFTNGEVVVTPYGDTLAEMEINASEDSRWKNIFAIIGIPWALTPVASQSSENSIIAGYKALVTNLVISELRKFDQKLTNLIQQWYAGIIAISDITEYSELAPDLALMKTIYGTPYVTVDENRKVFGYDELGGEIGEAILVPSGLMKIQDVISDEFSDMPPADSESNPNSL